MSFYFSGNSREASQAKVDKVIARQLSVLVRRAQREQIRQEKAKARILTAEQFGKIMQAEWRKVWGRLRKP
jgi:hypothetical protein